MEHHKKDGKRKNTILSYYTKTPKLQSDNLVKKNKLVSGFNICKIENKFCYILY